MEETIRQEDRDPAVLAAASRFYEAITEQLEQMEMTVEDFSEITGIGKHIFYGIKTRGTLPSAPNLARIAFTLGIDLNSSLAPLVPAESRNIVREYQVRKKKLDESRTLYERQELELKAFLKKFKKEDQSTTVG